MQNFLRVSRARLQVSLRRQPPPLLEVHKPWAYHDGHESSQHGARRVLAEQQLGKDDAEDGLHGLDCVGEGDGDSCE